jgi:hypothetical protein
MGMDRRRGLALIINATVRLMLLKLNIHPKLNSQTRRCHHIDVVDPFPLRTSTAELRVRSAKSDELDVETSSLWARPS